MRTKIYIAAFITLLVVAATATTEEPSLHGTVRYQLAVRYLEPDFTRGTVTAETELDVRGYSAGLYIAPVFETGVDSSATVDVREAYMDLFFPAADLRVGKQIVIWGKSDGVAITDIVSPRNLTNFLVPDIRDLRLGVTALKADCYIGPAQLELVYIPLFSPSRLPAPDSIWFVTPEAPVTPLYLAPASVGGRPADGEYYGRLGLRGSIIDLELAAGYFWSNEPAPSVTKTFSSSGALSSLIIQPEFYRRTMFGGSLGASAGPFILRGESAFFAPKRFLTTDMADVDGYVEHNYLHSLVGVDTVLAGVDLSAQIVHQYILSYTSDLLQEKHSFTATLRARESFFHESLTVNLLSFVELNNPNAVIKAGLSYAFTDALAIGIEGIFFLGESGQFGQFAGNDLAVVTAAYKY